MTQTAIFYGRQSVARSRDDKDGGSVSIAFQMDAAAKWCSSHNTTLVASFQDVDESGASTTRTGLNAALAEAKRVRPDYMLFWDCKRLSRNLKLFLTIFDELEDVGCQMVSVTEGTRHPPFVWKLLALMAEEERDRIAASITHGKREATKRGRHLGPNPLGYQRGPDGVLVPDPETRWIVDWMYARALEGYTPTAICRMANAQGIPTTATVRAKRDLVGPVAGVSDGPLPAVADAAMGDAAIERMPLSGAADGTPGELLPGGANGAQPSLDRSLSPVSALTPVHADSLTQWSRRTVLSLLRRPTYAGLVQSGASSRSRYGKALGIVTAEAPHEPLIDRASWQAVQAKLDGYGRQTARRGAWHWLVGRVTCAACGAPMYYVNSTRPNRSGTGRYPDTYWRCRGSYGKSFGRTSDRCPAVKARMRDDKLTQAVSDALYAALSDAARETDAGAVAQKIASQNGTERHTAREEADRRLADLQAQRLRINDAIQLGVGDLADLAQRDRTLIAAIESAQAERARLPEPVSLPVIVDALALVHRVRAEWLGMDDRDRAAFATRVGLRVEVDTDAGTVNLSYGGTFGAVLG